MGGPVGRARLPFISGMVVVVVMIAPLKPRILYKREWEIEAVAPIASKWPPANSSSWTTISGPVARGQKDDDGDGGPHVQGDGPTPKLTVVSPGASLSACPQALACSRPSSATRATRAVAIRTPVMIAIA